MDIPRRRGRGDAAAMDIPRRRGRGRRGGDVDIPRVAATAKKKRLRRSGGDSVRRSVDTNRANSRWV